MFTFFIIIMKKIGVGILVLIVVIFLVWLLVLPIPAETLTTGGMYVTTLNVCKADEDCVALECTQFQIPLPEPHFFQTGCINKNAFMGELERGEL